MSPRYILSLFWVVNIYIYIYIYIEADQGKKNHFRGFSVEERLGKTAFVAQQTETALRKVKNTHIFTPNS